MRTSSSPAFQPLREPRPTLRGVGFVFSGSTQGRAPSVPLLPPSQIDEARPPHSAGSLGEGAERAEKAEHEQAKRREFLFLPQT